MLFVFLSLESLFQLSMKISHALVASAFRKQAKWHTVAISMFGYTSTAPFIVFAICFGASAFFYIVTAHGATLSFSVICGDSGYLFDLPPKVFPSIPFGLVRRG